MNRILFYGGFGIGIGLFVLSILFFFFFNIPAVHAFFKRNRMQGLVHVTDSKKKTMRQARPLRITRSEYENLTEVLTTTQPITADNTQDTGEQYDNEAGAEEDALSRTEIL